MDTYICVCIDKKHFIPFVNIGFVNMYDPEIFYFNDRLK